MEGRQRKRKRRPQVGARGAPGPPCPSINPLTGLRQSWRRGVPKELPLWSCHACDACHLQDCRNGNVAQSGQQVKDLGKPWADRETACAILAALSSRPEQMPFCSRITGKIQRRGKGPDLVPIRAADWQTRSASRDGRRFWRCRRGFHRLGAAAGLALPRQCGLRFGRGKDGRFQPATVFLHGQVPCSCRKSPASGQVDQPLRHLWGQSWNSLRRGGQISTQCCHIPRATPTTG